MARARTATPSKGAAARAERAARPAVKTVGFRGLTLTLPDRLPGAILFDMGLVDDGDIVGMMRMVDSLFGREQYLSLRRKVEQDGLDFEGAAGPVSELLRDAFEAFGMAPGEAQASPDS